MKIKNATISQMPKGLFDPMPRVTATLEDGSVVELFDYYPDEISFTPAEFVGLLPSEAYSLKHKKDLAYLRS